MKQKLPVVPAQQVLDREQAQERLIEAGLLATDLVIPADAASASDQELEKLGELRAGARSSEDLIAEDRGR